MVSVDGSTMQDVSIHAPRVGERLGLRGADRRKATFQSTLPAWGSDCNIWC